jgi:DNA repair ATPase RecN
MASDKELLDWFKRHDEEDRRSYDQIDKRLKKIEGEIQSIHKKLEPMVEQDERVQWAAKKVITGLKVFLLILSIGVAVITLLKTGLWRG